MIEDYVQEPSGDEPRVRNKFLGTTAKQRSPNYPSTDYQDAEARVRKVHTAIRFGVAPMEIVASAMGYTSLNGTSRTSISALKKYGLLEDAKEGLRLTADAKTIVLLPPDDPEYLEAARRCALNPPLFQELFQQYGFNLPPDQTLKLMLVRRSFTAEAAKEVISNLKSTLEFLQHIGAESPTGTEEEIPAPKVEKRTDRGIIPAEQAVYSAYIPVQVPTAELKLTLPNSCTAHVTFTGNVTKEAVERLRLYLEFFAEDQPSSTALAVID